MDEDAYSKKCRNFTASGSFPRGQPIKTWNEVVRSHLKQTKVGKDRDKDKNVCVLFIKNCSSYVKMENRH